MDRYAPLIVWVGGAVFVSALALCAGWYLVPAGATTPFQGWSPIVIDTLLFTLFAFHHSVFARDAVKRMVTRVVPEVLMRSVYVWIASVLLILVCVLWRPIGGEFYNQNDALLFVHVLMQLGGIWLIARSVRSIDPLELAGIRHRISTHEALQVTGPYDWVRHPLYLGWILAVFGHAHMTGDRVAFAVISTAYLLVAIPFEERSLVGTFGDHYRSYQRRVRWRVIPYVY